MKIRAQLILGIIVTFLVLLGVMYATLEITVLGGIEKLEYGTNAKALNGMRTKLITDPVKLLGSNKDWSNWDETYDYMSNGDPIYIENNLMQSTFDNLKIDLFILLDTNGQMVLARGSQTLDENDAELFTGLIVNSSNFVAEDEDWELTGYMNQDGRLLEITASSVLTSFGEGPVCGSLIFVKELTAGDLDDYASTVDGTYRFVASSAITNEAPYTQNLWLKPVATEAFIGIIELPLIDSSKGYIEATLPRPINIEGLKLIPLLLVTFTGVFGLSAVIAIYMTDKTILKKIDDIGTQLMTLNPDETMTHMVELGSNELNTIIKGVNTLIDEIEDYKVKYREQERLAAMGKIASMVGHDLRNPLQVITSNSYMIKKKQEQWGPRLSEAENASLLRYVGTIEDQTAYMDKIVSDIQNYARDVKLQTTPSDIYEIIKETIATVRIPENIHISISDAPGLPRVEADSQLIRRVITNLVINAVQAMPDGGEVSIGAEHVGDFVRFFVKDTGIGMSQHLIGKLFTPFFTTKAKGSGLGLAAGKRIVEAHGGSIWVESRPGMGSSFYFTLPVSKNV